MAEAEVKSRVAHLIPTKTTMIRTTAQIQNEDKKNQRLLQP